MTIGLVYVFPLFCLFLGYLIIHIMLMCLALWFVTCKLGVDIIVKKSLTEKQP